MSKFFLVVIVLLSLVIPFSLFCYLVLKITKSIGYRILGIFASAIMSFVILSYVAGYITEKTAHNEAVKAGFTTIEEHKKAKSLGLDTKQQYENYKEKQAKILAEKQRIAKEKQAKALAEKAEKQRIAKEEQKKNEEERKQKEEKCKQDLTCLAEDKLGSATADCGTYIEKLAKYDFKWTVKGWFEQKFSHYRWKNKENGVITYIGDKAMFQNGFGAWQAHIYECDFDTRNEKVLDVRARPGRF